MISLEFLVSLITQLWIKYYRNKVLNFMFLFYVIICKSQKIENYLPYPNEPTKTQLGFSFDPKESIIPFTIGTAAKTSEEV